jgi:hypothetical protein
MESNVLKYIVKTLVVVAILALIIIGVRRCKSAEDKLEGYETNWIALSNENNKNAKSSKLYEFKLSQLKYINDSLMNAMDSVRKSLNIKDKNTKGLGYVKSTILIHDTVLVNRIRDGDKTISIDTTINKKWYQIQLDYRGSKCNECKDTLIVSPKVTSEKYVVISTQKEYVDTPKKFWIQRIFQKKDEVIDVKVVETNPYIYSNENRFVKVIK